MSFRFLLLLSLLCAASAAQEPLVRVNVDLAQIDVIVTDAKGKHITDLQPADFEIFENGRPQQITNFSFITTGTPTETVARPAEPAAKKGVAPPPVAPARLTPGQVTRTIAVVVDDLGLSHHSFANIRDSLHALTEQMRAGDLMAIITTSGRLGSLQRLTSDKRLLLAAIGKLWPLADHRAGILDPCFTPGPAIGGQSATGPLLAPLEPVECDPKFEWQRAMYSSLQTISSLRRVVDALSGMPGRKSILLFSEAFPLLQRRVPNDQIVEPYKELLAHANRSAVAINTIDARGLMAIAFANDPELGCVSCRDEESINSRGVLAEMARETGGMSVALDNDFSGAIGRVLQDDAGYYLVGYKLSEPSKDSGAGQRIRKVSVRLRRPGLKARFHSTLYEAAALGAVPENRRRNLDAALASPFKVPGVGLEVSSAFWDSQEAGSVLDTTVRLNARELTFGDGIAGSRTAEFEIVVLTYGSQPEPLDRFHKAYSVSLTTASYEKALSEGLVQHLRLPVKRPGPYQVRAAVRDKQSERVGAASGFVEVPDLGKSGLALSGILLSDGNQQGTAGANLSTCRRGQQVSYAYEVFNARPDASGSVNVEVQTTLFRDGMAIGNSTPAIVDGKNQPDRKRIVVTDGFRLGPQLEAGRYTLQVTAFDKNASEKLARAAGAVDFEIID